jgi:MSHA biogenesis protein MshQ
MSIVYGKTLPIVQGNLELHLDAANKKSYPGSGNIWYDLSGANRHGVFFGSIPFSNENGGKFKYLTSQITDYVSLPSSALRATGGNYTVEFWMQPITPPTTVYFNSLSNGSDHNYMLMYQSTTGVGFNAGGGNIFTYSNNETFQLTIVRNGSNTGTIYKNGYSSFSSNFVTVLSAAADNGWIFNQEQDSLGGAFDANQNYRGSIMVIKVYSRALSQNEVRQNFHALSGRYGI